MYIVKENAPPEAASKCSQPVVKLSEWLGYQRYAEQLELFALSPPGSSSTYIVLVEAGMRNSPKACPSMTRIGQQILSIARLDWRNNGATNACFINWR